MFTYPGNNIKEIYSSLSIPLKPCLANRYVDTTPPYDIFGILIFDNSFLFWSPSSLLSRCDT